MPEALSALQNKLDLLTLPTVQAEYNMAKLDARKKLCAQIEVLSANGPAECRTDDAMRKAVTSEIVSEPWATELIAAQKTEKWPLGKYCERLHAKVRKLMQRFTEGTARVDEQDVHLGKPSLQQKTAATVLHANQELHDDTPEEILYGEQRARFPHKRSVPDFRLHQRRGPQRGPHTPSTAPPLQRRLFDSFNSPFTGRCLKCGVVGHRFRQCTSTSLLSPHDVIKMRLQDSASRNGGKSDSYQVLYEVGEDLGDLAEEPEPELTQEEQDVTQSAYETFYTRDREITPYSLSAEEF